MIKVIIRDKNTELLKNIKYNILGGNMILKEIKKTNKKIFNSIKKIFE